MLPIYERLYLGGEYSIRGFDIRTVGPRDPETGIVLGGNKSLLFNAEYLINIAGPVRLVLFADAGQVRDSGQNFGWYEDKIQRTVQGQLIADSILDPFYIFNPLTFTPKVTTEVGRPGRRVQDLDRRGDPLLHAGAERAVPADFRDEPEPLRRARQQPAAGEEVQVPVRGGDDVLTRSPVARAMAQCCGMDVRTLERALEAGSWQLDN